jgi:hypothetical protein
LRRLIRGMIRVGKIDRKNPPAQPVISPVKKSDFVISPGMKPHRIKK